MVIVFWWLATGLTIAMQRADAIGAAGRTCMFALGIAGLWIVARTRAERSARSARAAFLGASLLWWCSAALFYSGWGMRIPAVARGAAGSAALAVQAVQATLVPDLVGVLLLAVLVVLTRRAPNRVSAHTFFVFWATLQMAKLNVFFGVVNPGTELLPSNLAGLRLFFGPSVNSALLPVSVALLALLTAYVTRTALRSRDEHVRHASMMLAVLLALAVLEHVLLGVSVGPPMYDVFLRMRG